MTLVLICMPAHNTLIIKQHKEPDHIKALIDIEPFGGGEGVLLENIRKIILKVVIWLTFACCVFALNVLRLCYRNHC